MGNAGADIVVDAGCCPAVIFLTLRKFFGRLRAVYGRSGGHRTQSLVRPLTALPTATVQVQSPGSIGHRAMSFIVLPLPPRRAAVAGSRAYRKWRGAAPLRGR